MVDFVKRVNKSGLLGAGETVEAASVLLPQGSIARMAGGAVGGLVGAAVAHSMSEKKAAKTNDANAADGGIAGCVPLGAQMTFAATDQRLVIFKNSAFWGKPKTLTGSLPWSQIAGAEADSGALKKKMTLRFVDGTSVNLEAGKVIKIEPLAEAINRRATRA